MSYDDLVEFMLSIEVGKLAAAFYSLAHSMVLWGRPQPRWEDCVRRDMRRSGKDEKWREGAADRKLGKERTERVVRQYFT